MELQSLKRYVEQSETRTRITLGYEGTFALGIGRDPKSGDFAFVLQVEADTAEGFPTQITLGGEQVSIVVVPNFATPGLLHDRDAR